MKKIVSLTTVTLLGMLFMPAIVSAQDFVPISGIPSGAIDTSSTDSYFSSLFNIFITVTAILAVIRLMLCGIQYMTSESIPAKSNARTCISYVIGGLFLMLLSVLILQQINTDLTAGSFDTITTTITDSVGDVSNLADDIALDGDAGAGAGLPGGGGSSDWYYTYAGVGLGNCSAGEQEERFNTVQECRSAQSERADTPIYVVESGCADNGSGRYTYTLANQCSSGSLTQTFDTIGNCANDLSEQISRRAYIITESCFDL